MSSVSISVSVSVYVVRGAVARACIRFGVCRVNDCDSVERIEGESDDGTYHQLRDDRLTRSAQDRVFPRGAVQHLHLLHQLFERSLHKAVPVAPH